MYSFSPMLFVLVNTLLYLSLPVQSFPLAQIYHEIKAHSSGPKVSHFQVRTAGPTHAGIITHPPAQLQQAIFGIERSEPALLPQSGLYTRGGLSQTTQDNLDKFLASNQNQPSYFYGLSIVGLGLHDQPNGIWQFRLRVDLAVKTLKDAKGHTKLPQLTVSYTQPHPTDENSLVMGDLLDIYELSEQDILETITTDEPAARIMAFLSSRVSRMAGFQHKHVGIEEFELVHPRTTDAKAAGYN
ncbi:hypothetical protein TWF106_010470 [Orbilia oligospora]|uniref:Uncharacterized protein n=2 Tax=Orbilia oligospora TaxID=2813651 RepID=A0A6G1M722_ORBOL|nr:hypothetical protein TWF679_007424 [Orbilia oligospora]KAF3210592.1 hypothetical protein TWF106_010470 [Orbilia oligospora]KAF3231058.1 hypothetical protein TWF191_007780 [Orbilia oligospora]KAF3247940.1 hypothetical protein TWF192_006430 [Orbilia oligospora]